MKHCFRLKAVSPPKSAQDLLPNYHSLIVSSIVGRKARALYACKAEHDSELSFIAGTIFENGESSSGLASRKEKGKNVGWCLYRNKQLLSKGKVSLGSLLDFI